MRQLSKPEKYPSKYEGFLHRLFFYSCLIFLVGCGRTSQIPADDQLKRFLLNDDVYFEFYVGVDSLQRIVDVWSEFRNTKTKEWGKFPGVLFIDNEFVRLQKAGNVIWPEYSRKPYQFAGRHKLSVKFSDNMKEVDMLTGASASENQDSLVIEFDVMPFRVSVSENRAGDSILLKPDKDINDQKVNIEVFGVNADSTGQRIHQSMGDSKNNQLSIGKDFFFDKQYDRYLFTLSFENKKDVMYRGVKKGTFALYYSLPKLPYKP